ncbi:MAG: S16 family serine protease, partial [Myxococcota bacterium]
TEMEKMQIAERYLIPRQKNENGVSEEEVDWSESSTRTIIQQYTREAGVRTLEREIGSVCRKIAKEVVRHQSEASREEGKEPGDLKFKITPSQVKKYLGVPKFRNSKKEDQAEVGMATGLAWTQMGGEILSIEVTTMPGKGKLMITGKLGDVMQESAQAAMSYVRSRAKSWGLKPDFYADLDMHIHVPEGAMPKDGPSAGITMTTALVSALTRIPVRHDIAMTGEITLRGRVLPIGGLKEKALAAHRAEIREIIIPKENEKDIEEIPKSIVKQLKIHPVEHIDQVLKHALELSDPDEFFSRSKDDDEGKDGSAESSMSSDKEAGSNPAPGSSSVQ